MSDTDALLAKRDKTHGNYSRQSARYAGIKAALIGVRVLRPPHAQALDMIGVKLARIVEGDPECKDHWDDIAGYAKQAADHCVRPLSPRIAESLDAIDARTPECPDLNQQYPDCLCGEAYCHSKRFGAAPARQKCRRPELTTVVDSLLHEPARPLHEPARQPIGVSWGNPILD